MRSGAGAMPPDVATFYELSATLDKPTLLRRCVRPDSSNSAWNTYSFASPEDAFKTNVLKDRLIDSLMKEARLATRFNH